MQSLLAIFFWTCYSVNAKYTLQKGEIIENNNQAIAKNV